MSKRIKPDQPRFEGTGYPIKEAVTQAERWWDRIGRFGFSKLANREDTQPLKYRNGILRAPMLKRMTDLKITLPSGILNGLKWSQLDRRSKLLVVKCWHQEYIYEPMLKEKKPQRKIQTLPVTDKKLVLPN